MRELLIIQPSYYVAVHDHPVYQCYTISNMVITVYTTNVESDVVLWRRGEGRLAGGTIPECSLRASTLPILGILCLRPFSLGFSSETHHGEDSYLLLASLVE